MLRRDVEAFRFNQGVDKSRQVPFAVTLGSS